MYVQIERPKENKNKLVANSVARKKSNVKQLMITDPFGIRDLMGSWRSKLTAPMVAPADSASVQKTSRKKRKWVPMALSSPIIGGKLGEITFDSTVNDKFYTYGGVLKDATGMRFTEVHRHTDPRRSVGSQKWDVLAITGSTVRAEYDAGNDTIVGVRLYY